MTNNTNNEDLYLKWLNDELSDTELDVLKKSNDFSVVSKIINETESWSIPAPKKNYAELKASIQKQSPKKDKVTPLFPLFKIAASILLLIGLAYFVNYRFFDTSTYYTSNQETKNIILPDGSSVTLNSNSSLHFNNYNWLQERIVSMEGQAYFDIQKNKGKFNVKFNGGNVEVLGTQFDVLHHEKYIKINCYEGKIKANLNKTTKTLTANMGLIANDSIVENISFTSYVPNWTTNFTSFKDAPLQEVLITLSLKYGVTYKFENESDIQKRFTGNYVNDNLELALEMVLTPLSYSYTKQDATIYITKK